MDYDDTLASFTSKNDSLEFIKNNKKDIDKALDKKLKLGLDLQGGMYVVLKVDVLDLFEKQAKNKDDLFFEVFKKVKEKLKPNLEFEEPVSTVLYNEFKSAGVKMSRYYYDIRDDDETILNLLNSEASKAIDRAKEIIRNRVDQYGVAEPNIATKGGSKIVVELPGVSDKTRIRRLLKGTAKLEFKIVKSPEITTRVLEEVNSYLAKKNALDSIALLKDSLISKKAKLRFDSLAMVPDSLRSEDEKKRLNPLFSKLASFQSGMAFVSEFERNSVSDIFTREDIQKRLPNDVEVLFDAKGFADEDGQKYYKLYVLKKQAELEGNVLTEAKVSVGGNSSKPEVSMKMNDEGTKTWARVTGSNIGKQVAIVLDGSVFQAPVIRSKIPNGSSVIENMESMEEAQDLEIVLKAGSLPAPVRIEEERVVGPSLGSDSVQAGAESMFFGLVVVILFMMVYYSWSGVVAGIAVVFNIFYVVAFLAGFGATLTLPGIAGLVLTVGMAVDANVLIIERIREELEKGRLLKVCVEDGYRQAFSAILDSHVTTFMAGALLYSFGVGPIQGFAVTLMVGIAVSLFTAVVITKVILDWIGVEILLRFEKDIKIEDLRTLLASKSIEGVVRIYGEKDVLIKTSIEKNEGGNFEEVLLNTFKTEYSDNAVEVLRVDSVGPSIATDLIRSALYALIGALVMILIYVAFRFEFIFGVASIVATLHDVIVVGGVFSIFGGVFSFLSFEFDQSIIAALLTVAGYSITDTVVVFDRIRENLRVKKSEPLEVVYNNSLNETLSRTMITSVTTLFSIIVLFLFAGPVIRGFAFAVGLGIVAGTYSSLFIAAPLALDMQLNELRKRNLKRK
ncbi:hypothetical protein CHS0354_000802 [Potamilus streckersoni]|uniref:Protein-export membrane protein SecF n=1 Tax=Potamilus streckersoni TaxID=2493646 RepID=A0AAE0T807_9BIVA|nr:hypothetical protein CHS0354_000802 [Potamilus streckersoni]